MKLKCWRSPKTERRAGGIHQLGLFAVQPVSKGELIAIKTGHIVDEAYIKAHAKLIRGAHIQLSNEYFYAPTTEEEWLDTLIGYNHSCEPNAYVKGPLLLAMRDIKSGEEIEPDYATCYTSDTQEFDCLCQTPSCRKHIKPSTDWQRPELQAKYRGYFTDFVQTKIDQQTAG